MRKIIFFISVFVFVTCCEKNKTKVKQQDKLCSEDGPGWELYQKSNRADHKNMTHEALMYIDSALMIDSACYYRFEYRAKLKEQIYLYSEAIEDVTKAIRKCRSKDCNYTIANLYVYRAELNIKNSETLKAFQDLDSSISVDARNWKAYNLRSRLFAGAGKLQDALHDVNMSIQIDNNEADSFMIRGRIKEKMGDIKGACVDFNKVKQWGFDEFDEWILEHCEPKNELQV